MINGVINVYKESGFTSHDVVNRLRRILGQKKIGHTGTLDPEARGVLPVCLGAATKLCAMFADTDKEYLALMRLGIVTDTQDLTGNIIEENPVPDSEDLVREAVMSFEGSYDQLPPMYSAVKVNGRKLYEFARKGIEIQRESRRVTIRRIDIEEIRLPDLQIRVLCSKGTYIRTLCADIGEKLGCGAAVSSLVRTRAGQFSAEDALTVAQIEESFRDGSLEQYVIPIDSMFPDAGKASVRPDDDYRLHNGNQFYPDSLIFSDGEQGKTLRLYDSGGTFAGLYEWDERRGFYHPRKMFLPM